MSITTTAVDTERSLSSSLLAGPEPELYFSCDSDKLVQGLLLPHVAMQQVGGSGQVHKATGNDHEEVMKDCVLTTDFERKECAPPITISKYVRKKLAKVSSCDSNSMVLHQSAQPCDHALCVLCRDLGRSRLAANGLICKHLS